MAAGLLSLSAIGANALTLGPVACNISNVSGSSNCQGAFNGNDANQDLSNLFGISKWNQFAKVDNDSGSKGGLTVTGGGTSGGWTISGITSDKYMIILKGGPSFSSYLLNSTTTSGTWNTAGLFKGNGDPGPGLSHFTVYVPDAQAVPEPLTILGSAVALGFGGYLKKEYAKKQQTKA